MKGKTTIKKNSPSIVSKNTLDSFNLRILDKISFLSTQIAPDVPLWKGPISICKRLEQNSLCIDTVISEAKKDSMVFNSNYSYRHYHAILCRVYILIYYRHHGKPDEERYQKIVIPRLKKNMGLYATNYFDSINKVIDEIVSQEEYEARLSKTETEKTNKGLTVEQARFFTDAVLSFFRKDEKKLTVKNDIAPLTSKLFGYTEESIKRNHACGKEGRQYVADLFKDSAPEFSIFLMNHGKKEFLSDGKK